MINFLREIDYDKGNIIKFNQVDIKLGEIALEHGRKFREFQPTDDETIEEFMINLIQSLRIYNEDN